jgi:hypothetical protein
MIELLTGFTDVTLGDGLVDVTFAAAVVLTFNIRAKLNSINTDKNNFRLIIPPPV